MMLGATMVVATLPVSDLDQARTFYGETLGLALLWDSPASIRFRVGSVSELSVFRRPGLVTEHTLAHFEVDDIEATVRDLEARGVQFVDYTEGPLTTTGHIAQLGPARGAWFRDPDGNFLGLRQD
ncbi:MAG TPA: VOC family protein [Candidatus Limnocylindrales bacterium]|nr:VOC family protein [Candidatus Limnocylindrales bacterium]